MDQKPAVILIDPQMGENIGACARAMLNCGLSDLRLVRPRDGWPNERAEATSSGALEKMPPVNVYEKTEDALKDFNFVLATTARPRDMVKPVFDAAQAAAESAKRSMNGQKCAFLFGAERTGLTNEDIALSHGIITIPLNPGFTSLNIAQAVLLVSYEWSKHDLSAASTEIPAENLPAPHEKMHDLFVRFETELESGHFFRTDGQKPIMIRNLRNMLTRAEMTEQEIRTFHGVISALTGKKTNRPQE